MPSMPACPACGAHEVTATPLAGPNAAFYCGACDQALTTSNWHPL